MQAGTYTIRSDRQFTLAQLLEFVAVCSILAALSRLTEVSATAALMIMTGSLTLRRGSVAFTALGVALVAVAATDGGGGIPRSLAVVLVSSCLILRAQLGHANCHDEAPCRTDPTSGNDARAGESLHTHRHLLAPRRRAIPPQHLPNPAIMTGPASDERPRLASNHQGGGEQIHS